MLADEKAFNYKPPASHLGIARSVACDVDTRAVNQLEVSGGPDPCGAMNTMTREEKIIAGTEV